MSGLRAPAMVTDVRSERPRPLRVLIVEARAADAELMVHELRRAGFDLEWRRVETEADYLAHLTPALDVILADYSLPQFDGRRALRLAQERGLDVPFIIVSAAVSEEVAVECMKRGADDYLLKDRLRRLGEAVTHAVRTRQLRKDKKKTEEMNRALVTVGRLLSETLDLDLVAQRVVDSIRELLNARVSHLFRLEPKSGDLVALAASGPTPGLQPGDRLRPEASVAGLAMRARQPAITANLLADPLVTHEPELRARLEQASYRSLLVVPLFVQDRVIGAVGVGDREGRRFTDHEVRLAQAFGAQAAVAIENARLFAAQREETEIAQTLVMLAEAVGDLRDLDEVLEQVVQMTPAILGSTRCGLFLLEPTAGNLIPAKASGLSQDLRDRFYRLAEGPLPVAAGVQLSGEPVVIDERAVETALSPEVASAFNVRSMLVIPLKIDGRMVGAITVDTPGEVHTFTPKQLAIARGIAAHAAVAIDRARLFAETDRRRQEAERLAAVGRLLSESLDPQEVGGRVVDHVRQLLGCYAALVYRLDPESGDLVLVASAGGDEPPLFAQTGLMPPAVGAAGFAIQTQQPVVVPDVLADLHITYPPEARARLERSSHRAIIALPLLVQDRVIGALLVRHRTGRLFDAAEVELAQAFAAHAAIALENSRLFAAHRHAEADLRGTNERLHALVHASPLAIVVLDPAGKVETWNAAAERIFGWQAAQVVGRPMPFAPDTPPGELQALLDRVRRGGAFTNFEGPGVRRDGSQVTLSISAAPLYDAGAVSGMITIIADITELKHAEAELQRQRDALFQSEKLAVMGSLLAGVAHELNNPLAVVLGQAALLRRTAGAGPVAARVDKIAHAAERCTRIVRNFLALARRAPPERKQVSVNQVVQEAVELLAYPLRVDSVEVRLDLSPELPVLWADPHQLHQVVVNLLSNAHQALRESQPPRQITIATETEPEQRRIWLRVADTGPGIPPEIQARIFEPFFTTKPPGQGSGLGLALGLGIIETHEGTIRVESEPGQGATFVVELPVTPPPSAEPEPPDTSARPVVRGRRVLVVDDEPEVAAVVTEALSADDHRVETAPNGAEVMRLLQKRSFDLIVSDVKMPGLGGPTLYQELERHHPNLCRRIVFLTGDTLSPQTTEFLERTGVPSLAKPFALEELRRMVQRALQAEEPA